MTTPDLTSSLAPCSIASRPLYAAARGLRPVLTQSPRRVQRARAGAPCSPSNLSYPVWPPEAEARHGNPPFLRLIGACELSEKPATSRRFCGRLEVKSLRPTRRMYLYRAVDSCGQTIDFLLSAKRDAEAAKRFFRKALAQPHTVNPRTITVDKNAAYPKAAAEMKKDGEPWRRSRLRQVKYLNNIVEQDHRRVKRLTGPGLGFGGFWTARRTLAGYEAMAMIKKRQVRNISGGDIRAQAVFIAGLFQVAA